MNVPVKFPVYLVAHPSLIRCWLGLCRVTRRPKWVFNPHAAKHFDRELMADKHARWNGGRTEQHIFLDERQRRLNARVQDSIDRGIRCGNPQAMAQAAAAGLTMRERLLQ